MHPRQVTARSQAPASQRQSPALRAPSRNARLNCRKPPQEPHWLLTLPSSPGVQAGAGKTSARALVTRILVVPSCECVAAFLFMRRCAVSFPWRMGRPACSKPAQLRLRQAKRNVAAQHTAAHPGAADDDAAGGDPQGQREAVCAGRQVDDAGLGVGGGDGKLRAGGRGAGARDCLGSGARGRGHLLSTAASSCQPALAKRRQEPSPQPRLPPSPHSPTCSGAESSPSSSPRAPKRETS